MTSKKMLVLFLVFVAVLGVLFWFCIRPLVIRKYCLDIVDNFWQHERGKGKTFDQEMINTTNTINEACLKRFRVERSYPVMKVKDSW
ncbi:MAG: hypothetical protein WC596_04040 [Candidatus Shapirobacteria bacterium]